MTVGRCASALVRAGFALSASLLFASSVTSALDSRIAQVIPIPTPAAADIVPFALASIAGAVVAGLTTGVLLRRNTRWYAAGFLGVGILSWLLNAVVAVHGLSAAIVGQAALLTVCMVPPGLVGAAMGERLAHRLGPARFSGSVP